MDWKKRNCLIDLGCSGLHLTWSRGNSPDTSKAARLDRGMVNEQWIIRFTEGAVRNLPRIRSDHCPILISTNGFAPIPVACKPFRFQAAWLHYEKFKEYVLNY